ncbi:Putative cytochrome P450 CYP13A1 [Leucoagaricus sp. SymC.cos]|nr:Putative cytochrome P450 CYP13A1 [Leucoagaricus sp. SymC.cos]
MATVSSHLSVPQLLSAAAFTWTLQFFLRRWIIAKRVAHSLPCFLPPGGALTLLNPFRTLALVLGPFYPFKGQIAWMWARFSLYRKYESTCIVSTTFWDAMPTYWFSDADAIKVVCADRFTFTKDVEAVCNLPVCVATIVHSFVQYETLNVYGPNLIGVEGSEWKRHRAIAKTAFNEANNAFVWRETLRIVNEWFAEIDKAATTTDSSQPTTNVDLLRDLTHAALLVIASAGFGRRSTWLEESNTVPPPGHRIHLSPAITNAISALFPRILTPKPIWNAATEKGMYIPLLGPMLVKARDAFKDLRGHMTEVVSQARDRFGVGHQKGTEEADDGVHGAALLKNLVEANMTFEKGDDAGHRTMTDGELFSNMFVFFLAGHETSAHTLCFAFVYLALHPEYQQRVLEEALKIYPAGVPPVAPPTAYKDNVPQLVGPSILHSRKSVFHETLRLCPPVVRLGKMVQKDTVLKSRRFSTSSDGRISNIQEIDVPVQKGGMCVVDILGVHMNPIHWGDDVDAFKPERFTDTGTYKWPRDAFLAFSGGPRSCIGQRFAIIEGICILASIVRRYEILLPIDVLGLSLEEQTRRLTSWSPGITIIPTNARVLNADEDDLVISPMVMYSVDFSAQ